LDEPCQRGSPTWEAVVAPLQDKAYLEEEAPWLWCARVRGLDFAAFFFLFSDFHAYVNFGKVGQGQAFRWFLSYYSLANYKFGKQATSPRVSISLFEKLFFLI